MSRRVAWLRLLLAACAGCAGTETGNPSFDGTLGYDAYSAVPTRVALLGSEPTPGAERAPIRVESAWFGLGDVGFDREGECDSQALGSLHVEGLGAGDHVGSHAGVTHVELVTARYCGVLLEFALQHSLPDAAPEDLEGHSVLVTGTREGVPFRIAADVTRVLLRSDGSAENTFELDSAHASVVIGFDLAPALDSLDWSKTVPDDDGTLRIDALHDSANLKTFQERFLKGIALFTDHDADGVVDPAGSPLTGWPE